MQASQASTLKQMSQYNAERKDSSITAALKVTVQVERNTANRSKHGTLTSVALQDTSSLLNLATENQGVGRVWQQQCTNTKDDSWDSSQAQGQTPSPLSANSTIVDASGCQDSKNGEGLEEEVEGSPPAGWGDL